MKSEKNKIELNRRNRLKIGFIWDIDGIVIDSRHEDAWRITAMKKPWCVKSLSSDFYFKHVASRSRLEGGNNILRLKGVYKRLDADTEEKRNKILAKFCGEKDRLIKTFIKEGNFRIFSDAVTLLLNARKEGIWQAAASASKNAKSMLVQVSKDWLKKELSTDISFLKDTDTLYTIFDIDACGLAFLKDKIAIQKYAAQKLNELAHGTLKKYVVFEDAPSGIRAAKSLGYTAVGILRIGDMNSLRKAGADFVVRDLSTIKIEDLV
jgi:beta-phosphoglucomutase-like phosphatase (HAD superfamily)